MDNNESIQTPQTQDPQNKQDTFERFPKKVFLYSLSINVLATFVLWAALGFYSIPIITAVAKQEAAEQSRVEENRLSQLDNRLTQAENLQKIAIDQSVARRFDIFKDTFVGQATAEDLGSPNIEGIDRRLFQIENRISKIDHDLDTNDKKIARLDAALSPVVPETVEVPLLYARIAKLETQLGEKVADHENQIREQAARFNLLVSAFIGGVVALLAVFLTAFVTRSQE